MQVNTSQHSLQPKQERKQYTKCCIRRRRWTRMLLAEGKERKGTLYQYSSTSNSGRSSRVTNNGSDFVVYPYKKECIQFYWETLFKSCFSVRSLLFVDVERVQGLMVMLLRASVVVKKISVTCIHAKYACVLFSLTCDKNKAGAIDQNSPMHSLTCIFT